MCSLSVVELLGVIDKSRSFGRLGEGFRVCCGAISTSRNSKSDSYKSDEVLASVIG